MSVTVIEGCAIATVDARRAEHADGHLVLEGPRIAAVGPGPAPEAWRARADRRIDGGGRLATPGLVNCHHHLYQWATRGYAQEATLFEWLVALYPVWQHIDAGVVDAAARAGLAALARSGCTTSTDHHYIFPRHAGDLLAVEIEAARAIGLRFHPCRGAMDLGAAPAACRPTRSSRTALLSAIHLDLLAFDTDVGNPVLAATIGASGDVQFQVLLEARQPFLEFLHQPAGKTLGLGNRDFAKFRTAAGHHAAPEWRASDRQTHGVELARQRRHISVRYVDDQQVLHVGGAQFARRKTVGGIRCGCICCAEIRPRNTAAPT